jgi:hypothetical protein
LVTPARACAPRRRLESRCEQQPPHGAGRDAHAEFQQLTRNPWVVPPWILARETQNELSHPILDYEVPLHRRRRAANFLEAVAFKDGQELRSIGCPDEEVEVFVRSRCARGANTSAPSTRASAIGRPTSTVTPCRKRVAVAFWRKDDRTRSFSSPGSPPAGRAYVGTPQPIPAKTDRPNEPLDNPAQPAPLHGSTDPENETAHSDPRRRERAATFSGLRSSTASAARATGSSGCAVPRRVRAGSGGPPRNQMVNLSLRKEPSAES